MRFLKTRVISRNLNKVSLLTSVLVRISLSLIKNIVTWTLSSCNSPEEWSHHFALDFLFSDANWFTVYTGRQFHHRVHFSFFLKIQSKLRLSHPEKLSCLFHNLFLLKRLNRYIFWQMPYFIFCLNLMPSTLSSRNRSFQHVFPVIEFLMVNETVNFHLCSFVSFIPSEAVHLIVCFHNSLIDFLV